MSWQAAVAWAMRLAVVLAALAFIFVVGGSAAWVGYVTLGYFVLARLFIWLVPIAQQALREHLAEQRDAESRR